jgi:tetratricopeptide (TPR) repeat protein
MRWKCAAPESIGAMPLESQVVEVCCRHQTLRTIVQTVADECGWSIDWTDLAQEPSLNRVVSMTAESQPLCVVLTIICSELQSTWTLADDRLIISRSRLNGEDRRGMIAQSLLSLTKWIPSDRYVDEARFALAEIAQAECCLLEAANLFAALAASNSSPMAIRAAANSADNFYRLRDYASACAQLKHVVDGGPGSQLHAESLVLLGRLELDLGDIHDAVFQLRRATDVSNSQDVQARASILLGLAYLLLDKYQEAAEAVFVRKFQFEDPEVRNAAAFVTSFARWKFTSGGARERESSYLYRSVISTNPDLEWLGQTGRLLIGRGYLELGFGDEMAELYSRMLTGELTENIRDEITFSLANYEMENDRSESAKRMWWTLANGRSKRLANRSRLRLAAVALLEERPKDCLEICTLIQIDDEVSVPDIQKLMGRAFEQLGEDQLAARCYAGQYKLP